MVECSLQTIAALFIIMYAIWLVFIWMHEIVHGVRKIGVNKIRKRRTPSNTSGVPDQPWSTNSIVLIPAKLGLTDLYPQTIPNNAPSREVLMCPKSYVRNTLQEKTSPNACVYGASVGTDPTNVLGNPFVVNGKVYKCPTGQRRTKEPITSQNACTGGTKSSFVSNEFSKMIWGCPFKRDNQK